ncbi:MAG: phosphopantothenoylcysteine decarboxylase [Candidatus Omnitrophota bacterium]
MKKIRKILITAGPVWVAIDEVRVISNISSGATGLAIAGDAAKSGIKVTLLLGPATVACNPSKNIKIIRFKYYDELKALLRKALKNTRYDAVVHAAAVSDYRPTKTSVGKIRSGKKKLNITLRPTEKLTRGIRAFAPGAFLVIFKLEPSGSVRTLLDRSYRELKNSGADLVVANSLKDVTETGHIAYLMDRKMSTARVRTNKELAAALLKKIRAGAAAGNG